MTRRLLVLALTFGITAAPLAVTLCQVLCADVPSSAAQHHSCHSDASASPTLTGVPHGCGHSTESPEGVERSVPSPGAHAAVMPALACVVPVPSIGTLVSRSIAPHPPGPPPPILQLRV
jgi:hypothetical protein